MGHYTFKGDPQLNQSPCHLDSSYFGLLRNVLTVWCWFQISELEFLFGSFPKVPPTLGVNLETRNPVVTIKHCHAQNSATVLPTETGPLVHDCIETIDTVYYSCPDPGIEPLLNTEEE